MKTYSDKQVQVKVANAILATLATPTYEQRFCDAVKKILIDKGVNVNTGNIDADIKAATDYLEK